MKINIARVYSHSLLPVICCSLLVLFGPNLWASELYFIDAHSQVDHKLKNLDLIIQRMDEAGVYRTILAARSKRKPGEVVSFAQAHSERIVPAVRTKSGAYKKNRPKYYKKLRKQLNSGHFRAMAEVLMYHAQKGDKAPEVSVYPDDQRVQTALNAAIKNGWPFIIHIEFRSLSGEKRRQFMASMEKLLKAHPGHAFALNHMGQLAAAEVRRLITNHKNIYFLTAHANPVSIRHSNQPWVNMFQGSVIAKEWKELLVLHPDRFIFALDNVWERHWSEYYLEQMEYWKKAMIDLPRDVAHAVAHGNAERLWNLSPK
ncbi:MAG: amidohydrolase family protein [Proteobacteria bacterium]|nr:amidohydrolase family protein [Pseudomonadota bacterium]